MSFRQNPEYYLLVNPTLANRAEFNEFLTDFTQFCFNLFNNTDFKNEQRQFFFLKFQASREILESKNTNSNIEFLCAALETILQALTMNKAIQIRGLLKSLSKLLESALAQSKKNDQAERLYTAIKGLIKISPPLATEQTFIPSFLNYCIRVEDEDLAHQTAACLYQAHPTPENAYLYIEYAEQYANKLKENRPEKAEEIYKRLLILIENENVIKDTANVNLFASRCYTALGCIYYKQYCTVFRQQKCDWLYEKYLLMAIDFFKSGLKFNGNDSNCAHLLIASYESYAMFLMYLNRSHKDPLLTEKIFTFLHDAHEVAHQYGEIRKLGSLQIKIAQWFHITITPPNNEATLNWLKAGLYNLLLGMEKEGHTLKSNQVSYDSFHKRLEDIVKNNRPDTLKLLFDLKEEIHVSVNRKHKRIEFSSLFPTNEEDVPHNNKTPLVSRRA